MTAAGGRRVVAGRFGQEGNGASESASRGTGRRSARREMPEDFVLAQVDMDADPGFPVGGKSDDQHLAVGRRVHQDCLDVSFI